MSELTAFILLGLLIWLLVALTGFFGIILGTVVFFLLIR